MHRRFWRAAVGAALALSALAWMAAAGEAGTSQSKSGSGSAHATSTLLGGVNIPGIGSGPPAEADRAVAQARALHATVVRTELPWSAFEPQRGQIAASTQAYADRLVSDAASDGIRVIMVVDSTPCWASSAPAPLLASCNPLGESAAKSWPPADPADYAAFVAYLAGRYGARLAALEVWNEPDQSNEAYFAGPDKAERYVALLRAAYPAIKAVDPSVPVLGGSIVGSNGAFLRLLYEKGMRGYYDGLAVHYYTLTLAAVRSIREVQLANGDTKPLWLDEFGWSSCLPRNIEQEQACVTPQLQAANLANTFRALARSSYVAAAVAYKLQDSPSEAFGVLSVSGARKPSFKAVASALASPFGSISPVTLRLRRKGANVIASGSAPVGDYMRLEVLRGKALRYWELFTLNRYNDYSITLPAVLGTHGLRVRVFQYWSGIAKDAQKKI
ncbi:MAG: glycosyl hydrolase [Solirubrobacteraceae bacterium]